MRVNRYTAGYARAEEIRAEQSLAAARKAFARSGWKWPSRKEVEQELGRRSRRRCSVALATSAERFRALSEVGRECGRSAKSIVEHFKKLRIVR